MNRNWQYTKRRLGNSFRQWRAEHLTVGKIVIASVTVAIFVLTVPLLVYLVLVNDVQNLQLASLAQIIKQDKVVVFGLDPAQDSITLRQQLLTQIPTIWQAFERDQFSALIMASPREFEVDPEFKLENHALALLPDSYDAWSFCNQLHRLHLNNVIVVADSLDIPKIGFVCKNLGLNIHLYAYDIYPSLTRGGLFLRSLIETVSLVWRVNSSTITV